MLGVDLAAGAASTGAVEFRPVGDSRWRATEIAETDDDGLVRAARGAFVIGVDSPLGWPIAFVEAVAAHTEFRPWTGTSDRSTLTHRDTDRAIRQLGLRPPLSVSADKLGSVAMRCALLQRRWADEVWASPAPRDGSGPLVETYPAAAFTVWGIESNGYKRRDRSDDATTVRARMTDTIADAVERWLDLEPIRQRCIDSDHVLDALACALVAVASKSSSTHLPSDDQRPRALIEGWIHIPSQPLSQLAPQDPDNR